MESEYVNSVFSLIPPLLAIVMVILTRRVLLSLGLGIFLGALMLHQFDFAGAIAKIFNTVRDIFVTVNESTWEFNTWNIFILLFLLILGMMTAFISMAGGTRAFGDWAIKRVKSRKGAQLLTVFLGIIVFIDDYFNSLAVGQVSRPLTDRHRISRAKLAYYLDSTAAPICVVSPISSWGAYIIGLIGTVLVTHQVTEYSAFTGFLYMIPMNLYAVVAILLVIATAWFNINFGFMRKHEEKAMNTGEVRGEGDTLGVLTSLPESHKGRVSDLIWPIIALLIGTVSAMVYTGYQAVASDSVTILAIFENTAVAKSLVYGGLAGLIVTLLVFLPKGFSFKDWRLGFKSGIKSMLPAIFILITAWTITTIISELETGTYLAGLVQAWNIPLGLLPALIFIFAAFMAFSTGTSWGTFGLMLPIAGQVAANTDVSYMLPMLAAVLAGSVLGDHCSPISDTTILSSTGAGCDHMDHVNTQLPYAIVAGGIAVVGYLVLGFTGSTILGFATSIALLIGVVFYMKKTVKPIIEENLSKHG
ncbi:Na+/H+ antiporter NhaC family protein [Halobacillus shinanisalinarum]|uniref:Na+/H+ antiporter NhaC family protein n=1 Tax=Halobacillus shinanisalinarum TaxID=2932258 RepID=A0ABY4GYB8_9BACI|nr:Na+/H+ antiporter NhaC family protein [Halobacillus shinanisalinarum]UOQ92402.1 Na+/H+ antiporter NhaC family protein [Halobacillus shinanisalinarum]